MTLRIGINGFGRIGRCLLKILHARPDAEVVAINDLADKADLAYLLKYDSTHGWYPRTIQIEGDVLRVDEQRIAMTACAEPRDVRWGERGTDVVVDCTGAFRARAKAALHLDAGARKVILSAPSEDCDATLVLGCNEASYDPARHHVVSMASCTTNSLAPVAKVLLERFGVDYLMFTTVHAYTSSQSLVDTPTRKRRRGRAAALSIVPTSTGAATATAAVLPALKGKVDGLALRVPVPDGSVTDITAMLMRKTTVHELHKVLEEAACGPMKGILRVNREEIVSRDVLGDPHSSIVDAPSTSVLDGRIAKILAWYDNEWGYAARLADLAALMAMKGYPPRA